MYSLKIFFLFFLLIHLSLFPQSSLYQSAKSGSWDSLSTWKIWDGVAYHTPTADEGAPDFFDSTISILNTHTVVVKTNITIDNLIVNSGATLVVDSAITIAVFDGLDVDMHVFGTLVNKGVISTIGSLVFEYGSVYQHNFSSMGTTRGIIPSALWLTGSTCEIIACGNSFVPSGLNQLFYNFIWNNPTQPQNFNLVANPTTVNGNFEIKNTNSFQLRYKSNTAGDLTILKNLIIEGGSFVLTNGSSSTIVNVGENFYQSGGTFDLSTSSSVSAAGHLLVSKGFFHVGGDFRKSGSGGMLSEVCMNSANVNSTIESIGFKEGDQILFNITQTSGAQCRILSNKIFTINTGTVFTVNDNETTSADLTVDGTFVANTHTWNFLSGVTAIGNGGLFLNNTDHQGISSSTTLIFNSGSIFRHNVNGGSIASALWNKNSILEIVAITTADTIANSGQLFGKVYWNCPSQISSALLGSTNNFSTQNDYHISSTGTGTIRFPDIDFIIGGDLIVEKSSRLQLSKSVGLYLPNIRTITVNGNVIVKDQAFLSVGAPNNGNVLSFGEDKYRDYVLLLKKNFIYSSSVPMVAYCQRNFVGANNNESYRLVFDFSGNAVQNINYNPISSEIVTVAADEYISNNIYEIKISGNATALIPFSSLKINKLLVSENNLLDLSKGLFNLIHYSLYSSDGSLENPSTMINGTIDFGENVVYDAFGSGGFLLNAGATMLLSNSNGIDSVGLNGAVQVTGTRFFSEEANYIYNANHNQVTGTGLPSNINASLTINNTIDLINGGLLLSRNTNIAGVLNLTQGKLMTSPTSLITIENNGSVFPEGGKSNSFIDGPIKKVGFVAGNEFVFPTGDTTKWARIGFKSSTTSLADAFTAEYFKSNPQLIDTTLNRSIGARLLNRISAREYWDLDRTIGIATGKVKLYWEDAAFSGIINSLSDDLRVAHYHSIGLGLKWYSESETAPFVNIIKSGITGSVESFSDFITFSPTTFGSADGQTALPIELLSFKGNNIGAQNKLEWETASEINNDYFQLERSSDGIRFYPLATVKSYGNSKEKKYYHYWDEVSNNLSYYRLKQVDYDGTFTYSKIISLNINLTEVVHLNIYPNPTIDKIFINSSDKITGLEIYNGFGNLIEKVVLYSTDFEYEPKTAGVYFLKIETVSGGSITKYFVRN